MNVIHNRELEQHANERRGRLNAESDLRLVTDDPFEPAISDGDIEDYEEADFEGYEPASLVGLWDTPAVRVIDGDWRIQSQAVTFETTSAGPHTVTGAVLTEEGELVVSFPFIAAIEITPEQGLSLRVRLSNRDGEVQCEVYCPE